MALTDIEIVRLLSGDTQTPSILTDDQISYYLTINDDDTSKAAEDCKAAIVQILAVNAINIRTEDLWEDRRETAKYYIEGIDKSEKINAKGAYPIIGGCDTYKGNTISQFDEENNWETDSDFYNDYEYI